MEVRKWGGYELREEGIDERAAESDFNVAQIRSLHTGC